MNEEWTTQQVKDIVENEGLGYALTGYLGPSRDRFEDKRLGQLWDEAYEALNKLEKYLDEN